MSLFCRTQKKKRQYHWHWSADVSFMLLFKFYENLILWVNFSLYKNVFSRLKMPLTLSRKKVVYINWMNNKSFGSRFLAFSPPNKFFLHAQFNNLLFWLLFCVFCCRDSLNFFENVTPSRSSTYFSDWKEVWNGTFFVFKTISSSFDFDKRNLWG